MPESSSATTEWAPFHSNNLPCTRGMNYIDPNVLQGGTTATTATITFELQNITPHTPASATSVKVTNSATNQVLLQETHFSHNAHLGNVMWTIL